MRTNTIGPILVAQKLLQIPIPIGTIVFMSSDSGSATSFRAFEDGYRFVQVQRCPGVRLTRASFAAYAASKAALNQSLRVREYHPKFDAQLTVLAHGCGTPPKG